MKHKSILTKNCSFPDKLILYPIKFHRKHDKLVKFRRVFFNKRTLIPNEYLSFNNIKPPDKCFLYRRPAMFLERTSLKNLIFKKNSALF